MQGSTALASAAGSGNASATRAALESLLNGQIVRIEVLRGGRVLAAAGAGGGDRPRTGLDPGHGGELRPLRTGRPHLPAGRPPGHRRPGAAARGRPPARRHDHRLAPRGCPPADRCTSAGSSYQVFTLAGRRLPLRRLCGSPCSCPPPASPALARPAQTRVETLGHVGERIYQEELHSADVAATLRRMENSTVFQDAVAARDAAATTRGDRRLLRRPHPRRAGAGDDRLPLLDRRRRALRPRPRPRHPAQRRAVSRDVLDGDPGRRRVPQAGPPFHRCGSADADGEQAGDGLARPRAGLGARSRRGQPTAGATTRPTRSSAKPSPPGTLRISLLIGA